MQTKVRIVIKLNVTSCFCDNIQIHINNIFTYLSDVRVNKEFITFYKALFTSLHFLVSSEIHFSQSEIRCFEHVFWPHDIQQAFIRCKVFFSSYAPPLRTPSSTYGTSLLSQMFSNKGDLLMKYVLSIFYQLCIPFS